MKENEETYKVIKENLKYSSLKQEELLKMAVEGQCLNDEVTNLKRIINVIRKKLLQRIKAASKTSSEVLVSY